MPDNKKPAFTAHTLRELSVAIPCDPRTLLKALRGEPVQFTRRVAIERVLAARGLAHLLPPLSDVTGGR